MTQWHGGKGSKPRPYSVTQDEYDHRWENIFGKNKSYVIHYGSGETMITEASSRFELKKFIEDHLSLRPDEYVIESLEDYEKGSS